MFGSFERFIAILREHYAGAFPAWLAPVQARIVTVSERFDEWARSVKERMTREGWRVELDGSSNRLQPKIRNAEMDKIPFILVIGEKEVAAQGMAPRRHGVQDLKTMSLDTFLDLLRAEGKPPY